MAAFFFPLTRAEVRANPKAALEKMRKGGITGMYEGVRVPFCRVQAAPEEIQAIVKDAQCHPSFNRWTKDDFMICPALLRVPEKHFRAIFREDGMYYFVGGVNREWVELTVDR